MRVAFQRIQYLYIFQSQNKTLFFNFTRVYLEIKALEQNSHVRKRSQTVHESIKFF